MIPKDISGVLVVEQPKEVSNETGSRNELSSSPFTVMRG